MESVNDRSVPNNPVIKSSSSVFQRIPMSGAENPTFRNTNSILDSYDIEN